MAPKAKSGTATRSTLSAGVGQPEVVGEEAQAEGADLEGEGGQGPLPGTDTMRRGRPSTSTGDGQLEGAHDEGDQVGRHGMVSAKRTRHLPSAGAAADPAPFERAARSASTTRRDREDGLVAGLVPAREGAAGIGRLELGGGDDLVDAVVVGEGAAVEAVELVVEDAGEPERTAGSRRRARAARRRRSWPAAPPRPGVTCPVSGTAAGRLQAGLGNL